MDDLERSEAFCSTAIREQIAGNSAVAIDQFRQALNHNPRHMGAIQGLAIELVKTGACSEALALLEDRLEMFLGSADRANILSRMVDVHVASGDPAAARALVDRMLAEHPDIFFSYIAATRLFRSLKLYDELIAVLANGIPLLPAGQARDYAIQEWARSRAVASIRATGPFNAENQTAGRPIENAVYVSMFKDEGDIIYENLAHYYKIGFRKFVLSDNRSTDTTRQKILQFRADFPDATAVIVDDVTTQFLQGKKVTALASIAFNFFSTESRTIEWVFPVDADEFLHVGNPEHDLAGILATDSLRSATIITLLLVDYYPRDTFATTPEGAQLWSSFRAPSAFDDMTTQKIAFRWSATSEVQPGNHYVTGRAAIREEVCVGQEVGLSSAHFQWRSIEQVTRKIIRGGAAMSGLSLHQGGMHWRELSERYKQRGPIVAEEVLRGQVNRT